MNGMKFIEEEDPKLMLNGLTPGTSQQQMSPAIAPPIAPPVAPPIAAPAGLKPPAAPMAQPPVKLPGMPADVTPDEISSYLDKQRGSLNKFGPQEQMNFENESMQDRDSFRNRLTSGVKGLADSVMMGVAGAGNPGWQQQYENRQDRQAQEGLGAMQEANKSNITGMKAGMELDMMDPNSPTSQAYRESFTPIFTKMGYNPDDIKKMSASQIGTVADLATRHADSEAQLELKKALLGVETMKTQAGIENQNTESKQGALKQLSGMPWYSRILHPGIAKELEKQSGIGEDDEDLSSHAAAFIWAKSHPEDPRSADIIKRAASALGGE